MLDYSVRICRGLCNQVSGMCMGVCLTDHNYAAQVYHRHKANIIATKGVDAWVEIPEFENVVGPAEDVPEQRVERSASAGRR